MKKFFSVVVVCLSLSFAFMSCSDDDNEGEGSKLSPEENKAKLEQVGLGLLSKFNAADHKDLVVAASTFDYLLSEFELPGAMAMSAVLKSAKNVFEGAKMESAVELASMQSDIIEASQYYGTFTFANNQWNYVESQEALTFVYPCDKKTVTIRLNASGNEVPVPVEGEGVTVKVPEKIVLSMTSGTAKLLEMNLDTKISATPSVALNMAASGYTCDVALALQSGKSIASAQLAKNGEALISLNLDAETDLNKIMAGDVNTAFGKSSVKVDIMNSLNVVVGCSDVKVLMAAVDGISGSLSSKAYAEQEAAAYNKYLSMEMRYEDGNDAIAKVEMQPYLAYTWGEGNEDWDIESVIVFAVDESRHSFEEYFDEVSFQSVITKLYTLLGEYGKLGEDIKY